jgi:uncharacterized membrane protein YeaQ/YmgE (transglycosylase-associated protein family)
MLLLSLLWLVIGVLVGALAAGARLRPARWSKRGWLTMPGVGMVSSLFGGWLGAWLFGSQYGTVTALWVGVMGVGLLPRFFKGRKMVEASSVL